MSISDKVTFEWDPEKARRNRIKHLVSFELAREVWDNPLHVIVPDRVVDGEERWHAVGIVGAVVLLVVVHTYPRMNNDTVVRIIGARKATKQERQRYEQGG
ncbi:BrnT family toxin [Rhizobium sp. SL86]|uniref:BrnT family toxin n=1 Tax=Rhizobium sp. SL86 TaxID=2995148 RepID=UPI002274E033|nr:BrnT family toxin [Rhizobium sp. SL86]MCY1664360.1 BrnT family toxin [Rhizobium sp. SL86]